MIIITKIQNLQHVKIIFDNFLEAVQFKQNLLTLLFYQNCFVEFKFYTKRNLNL